MIRWIKTDTGYTSKSLPFVSITFCNGVCFERGWYYSLPVFGIEYEKLVADDWEEAKEEAGKILIDRLTQTLLDLTGEP
jgi:hypothetical protein